MKIQSITVLDNGQPTEAGLDPCKLVYEKVTGRCWHDWNIAWGFEGEKKSYECTICGLIKQTNRQPSNPPLLTSLDAIHELEVAYFKTGYNEMIALADKIEHIVQGDYKGVHEQFALAHIRLQALAMCLEAECSECGGTGFVCTFHSGKVQEQITEGCECEYSAEAKSFNLHSIDKCENEEECDCKDGKTTVFDNWTRKWEGNDAD